MEGTASPTFEARSDPPAPPGDASDEELRTWITRYIDKGNFVEASSDANRVILYDPGSLEKLPGGHVVGWVRSELFRPRVAHGKSVRSDLKKLEIDCRDWRYRILDIKGYAGSNLQQPVAFSPVPDSWTPPLPEDGSAGMVLRRACGALDTRR